MNSASKVAKYFAFGLAGLIIFAIITGIVGAVSGILMAVGLVHRGAPDLPVDCEKYEKCLSVSVAASNLVIKKGDKFTYESESDKLAVSQSDTKLSIRDESKGGWNWIGSNENRKTITVTIPEGMEFDNVGIAGAAGRIAIERLVTKDLKLDLGAGETTIDYVKANGNVKIDSGVGRFEIKDGALVGAGIHLGVGEASIRAKLTGNSKIDAGIGSVNLNLLLPESAYTIKAEKGIGKILYNGSNVSDDTTIGNGTNYVDVDGGIGQINITTASEVKQEDNTQVELQPDNDPESPEEVVDMESMITERPAGVQGPVVSEPKE